jgi:hypothetical protein
MDNKNQLLELRFLHEHMGALLSLEIRNGSQAEEENVNDQGYANHETGGQDRHFVYHGGWRLARLGLRHGIRYLIVQPKAA